MRDLWQTPLKGLTALCAILFSITLVVFLLSISNFVLNGSNRVDFKEIYYAPIETVTSPMRFETRGVTEKYQSQFWPRQNGSRHFHLSFEGEPLDKTPHTLWIPHVGADTSAYINNARSGAGGQRTNILLGTGQEALIYNIPRIQILPGRNRIDIYVKSDPTRSGLGPVYLGPTERIAKQIKRSEIISQLLPLVAYVAALFGLILNLLAILTSKSVLKHGALSLASASLVALYQLGGGLPVFSLAIGVVIYAVLIMKEDRLKPLNSLLISTALSGPFLLSFRTLGPVVFPDPSLILATIWLGPLPIIIFPPLRQLLITLAQRRSRLDELEEALDDTKGNLEKEIRRRAVLEERERLTRDIHDGVGGQLLGLLLRLRTGDVPKASITRDLQSGLNDLRLVVDALDHTGNDLGQALSAFRDRATNQLDAAGLSLKWTQVDGLNFEPQGRDGMLNLYRILQEALNNIIRHSKASEVEVDITTQDTNRFLQIKIQDDGIGRKASDKPGRGTLNMQRRADILGGNIKTGSGLRDKGHSVTVTMPMSKVHL